MTSHFTHLITQLTQQLGANKPGPWAQQLMMPEGRLMTPSHKNPPTLSAVLLALYEWKGDIYFPVIRRPTYNGLHSGQMAFPGGKFEKSDRDLQETALRECEEEVGIQAQEVTIIDTLSELYIPVTNMHILPVVGFLKEKPRFQIDPHEVDAIFYINLSDILDPVKKIKEVWNLRGSNIEVPFYALQEQKVWGATAMILSEFEQVLLQCFPKVDTT